MALTPSETMVALLKEHDKVSGARFEILEQKVEHLTGVMEAILEAMTAAVELEQQAPDPESQGDVLAQAISQLASEQKKDEPETEFPAWGAPLKKGK